MKLALVAAALLALPSVALADAIDGPPACPPGAVGRSSHSGQWCEPAPCTTDADCAATAGQCRAWRVCTQHASIPPGGLGQFRDPPPPPDETDEVVGSCDPARACRGDEEPPPPTAGTLATTAPTCRDATFCVPDALPSLPPSTPPSTSTPPPPSTAPSTATATAPSTASSSSPSPTSSCSCIVPSPRAPAPSLAAPLALALVASLARRRR